MTSPINQAGLLAPLLFIICQIMLFKQEEKFLKILVKNSINQKINK